LGTIWVFAQRAINDLQQLLATQEAAEPAVEPPLEAASATATVEEPPLVTVETAEVEAIPEAAPVVEAEMEAAEMDGEAADIETTQEMEIPSLDAIREFLGIEAPELVEGIDLDSFWDDALEETGRGPLNSSGMSLEEARKQGLIPTEFDQPGRKDSEQ
jgi:hypothetical protein